MAKRKRTQYEIVDFERQTKFKDLKAFKSIKAIHNFMLENKNDLKGWCGIELICHWFEIHPDYPTKPFNVGYRTFILDDNGDLSYNRFPTHEF
jgi:hypothetical protein